MTDRDDCPKVLIVVDNRENLELLLKVFRDHYRVAAASPERALRLARGDDPPDLIITDILMPEMDGHALTVSMGAVTVDPYLRVPLRAITDAADEALYAAKHGGRHRVEGRELRPEPGAQPPRPR